MKSRALMCGLSLVPFGCGGNGGSTAASGRATLSFQWPARTKLTKLIPVASNSIKINVSINGQAVTSQTMPRPSGTQTSTVTFANLPVGDLTFEASAYPTTDATGIVQSSASTIVHIVKNVVTPFTITMDSSIDHLELAPNAIAIPQGQSADVTVTARDKANQVVMLSGSTLSWKIDNTTIASTSSGLITARVSGTLVGNVNLTVTETESTKTLRIPVTVSAGTLPRFTSTYVNAGGTSHASATGMNDNGDSIVGNSYLVGSSSFEDTRMVPFGKGPTLLTNFPGYINSRGSAIGNNGTIVGVSFGLDSHSVIWTSSTATPSLLPTNGTSSFSASPSAISTNGTIVGVSNIGPVIWTTSGVVIIPTFPGGPIRGSATAINDSGVVVGYFQDEGNLTAFYYDGTTHRLPDYRLGSQASGINAAGDIVGFVNVSSTISHAAKWHNGVLIDLGVLMGNTQCSLNSINVKGQIIGSSDNGNFLLKDGTVFPLSALGSFTNNASIVRINNNGQMLVQADNNSCFILTPN